MGKDGNNAGPDFWASMERAKRERFWGLLYLLGGPLVVLALSAGGVAVFEALGRRFTPAADPIADAGQVVRFSEIDAGPAEEWIARGWLAGGAWVSLAETSRDVTISGCLVLGDGSRLCSTDAGPTAPAPNPPEPKAPKGDPTRGGMVLGMLAAALALGAWVRIHA